MRHFSDFLELIVENFIGSNVPHQAGVMIPGHYLPDVDIGNSNVQQIIDIGSSISRSGTPSALFPD